MNDIEKGTVVQTVPNMNISNISNNSSISQGTSSSQGVTTQEMQSMQGFTQTTADGGKRKNKRDVKKNKTMLGLHSRAYSVALKFYDEQLPYGWDKTVEAIQTFDKTKLQIIAICHNRDVKTDGIWLPSLEKKHYHIWVRCTDRKKRIYVHWLLNSLGIHYRQGYDEELWQSHGVETCGDFNACAVYATHETEKAIRDGKEKYELDEIVSNLSRDEVLMVRDGYSRLSQSEHKVTPEELIKLDTDAYNLGYELKNFDSWYNSQSFAVRSCAKIKTIKESYERGVATRVEEHQAIVRLCVFIKGEPDVGKTTGAEKAVTGKSLIIKGGGSGKFDRLCPDHNALIFDDDICPNLLNMSDNYICRAYRRNSNNQPWAGQYLIVTSNVSFEEWVDACGIDIKGKHFDAIKSRFYICEIVQDKTGVNKLRCTSVSARGSIEEQQQRLDLFIDFKRRFDESLVTYHKVNGTVNYSVVLDCDDLDNDVLKKMYDDYANGWYDSVLNYMNVNHYKTFGGNPMSFDDWVVNGKPTADEICLKDIVRSNDVHHIIEV